MNRAWKNRAIKAAAKLLTVVLTTTSCLSGTAFTARAEGYGKNGIVRDITSQQLVEDMGLGYNIGNTFDSIGSFIQAGDPWEYQKGWGNEPVSKLFIQKVKEGGFKTIRLPVSWAHWIDGNNQVNPGYMSAVQTVVDWCMEEDLYVILNIHHDSGAADTSWIRNAATDFEGTTKKYGMVWTQIAENFKGYGDHLIFEGMNEVEFPDAPSMSRQYEILNAMNQLFVDSVRNTGGNNAMRHLLIPGYNTDIKKTCDRRYQMPKDPAGHCILSIHYYSPSPFCVAEHNVDWAVPETTWGTAEDIQAVEADLDILAERFQSKGTPVIIGEYGVLTEDNKEPESIRRYLKTVPEIIMQYGMCPVLWDTSNAGDMKFIERVTGEFYDPVIKANYQELAQRKASGQIGKKEFNFPNYQRVAVPVNAGGWVSLASYEPSKILGVAFSVKCASDWDSYGGGGIYIDSWDDTIQYQFNSVYDEIVHIFTEEERARIKDQLSVAIWWTDESKGGNRRDELSIKDNLVYLLYGENDRLSVPGQSVAAGGGAGGSGGGSGSGSPNGSTNPGGGDSNGGTKDYQYILKADRASAPEGDTETGVQRLNLAEICPGYAVGDTVKITVEPLADGGYSFALQATENGTWLNSDSWGPDAGKNLSWECTPDDGMAAIYLWYLGGSYVMFNVKVEIVKKASVFGGFDVDKDMEETEDGGYAYDLSQVFADYQVEAGKRVKVTVRTSAAADGDYAEGEVWFTDVNGVKVSGDIGPESPVATLIGIPKNGKLIFTLKDGGDGADAAKFGAMAAGALAAGGQAARKANGQAGGTSLHVDSIRAEQQEDADILGELQSKGRIEVPSAMIKEEEGAKGEEGGYKVYFSFDGEDVKDAGAFSANLVVNNDWSLGNDAWEIREDEGGQYIWRPYDSPSNIILACWYNGGYSFRVNQVVRIKSAEAGFASFDVTKEHPAEGYSLAELMGKKGIPEGSRIKATVTVSAGDAFGGEASGIDANGTKVVAQVNGDRAGSTSNTLIGVFPDSLLSFKVNDDSKADGYTVTDIQVEKLEGDAIGEFQNVTGGSRIEFASKLIEEKEAEDSAESGLKVYCEYDGDVKSVSANLLVNGNWDYSNEQWTVRQDGDGASYIWYPCEKVDSVIMACWYLGDESFRITKLVHETKKTAEEDKFASFEVTKDKPAEGYSLAELMEKNGIDKGSRVKVTVAVSAQDAFGGEASGIDANGTKVVAQVNGDGAGNTSNTLIGIFPDSALSFKVNDDSKSDGYTVTDIQVESLEGDAIGEFQNITGGSRIEFASKLIEEEEAEDLEESGLKVYCEYDGEVKSVSANLIVNGDWDYSNEQWAVKQDGDGASYIWYPCEKADSVIMACWYLGDESFRITKLVHQVKKSGEEPELPELKENEKLAVEKAGKYYVPEGEGIPSGMRFAVTGAEGVNINVNNDYWGWKKGGEIHAFDAGTEVEYLEFFPDEGAKIQYVVFVYPDQQPEEPDEKEVSVTADADGKFYVPEGKGYPTGMRYTATGNAQWTANAEVNGAYWKSVQAGQEYLFDEGMEVEYVSFYLGNGGEVTEVTFIFADKQPEEPEPSAKEVEVEADENGRFYIPEGYGIPKAIRFIASTNNKYGASLALCDSTNEWLDGSENWVGFTDNVETTYTFKEGVTFEYLKFNSSEKVEVSQMIFIYGDTSEAASLAAAVTYGTPRKGSARLQDVLVDETGELLADHDADGNYYLPKLPEGSGIKPVGIRAELSSKAKAVTFLWNQGDEETEVTPVNGKAYYLFTEEERDNIECVSFKSQKVRNVTVLYWNCEEAKAADEEEGAFDLPDYRIPAAISYTWSVDEEVKDGEKEAQKDAQAKEAGVKLTAKVYDREAGSWKEEGIVLAGNLEVNPEGANVYIITEKNRKALEKVFEEARKAGAAPRLSITAEGLKCSVQSMDVYYDQPYTDEDEITGLAENENQDTAQEAGSSDEAEDMDGKPEEDKDSQEGSAEEGKPEEPITEGQGKEGSEKEDPAKEESEEEPSAPEDKGQLKSGARKASMPDVRPGQLTIGQEGGFSR